MVTSCFSSNLFSSHPRAEKYGRLLDKLPQRDETLIWFLKKNSPEIWDLGKVFVL
jgi:uncharacterized protein (DUF3820 family)